MRHWINPGIMARDDPDPEGRPPPLVSCRFNCAGKLIVDELPDIDIVECMEQARKRILEDTGYGPNPLEAFYEPWWWQQMALKYGVRSLDFPRPPLHWYERGLAGRALRFRLGLRPILQRTIRVMRNMIGFSSDLRASAPSS